LEGQCTVVGYLTGVAQQAQLLAHHIAVGFVVLGNQNQAPRLSGCFDARRLESRQALLLNGLDRIRPAHPPTGHGHAVNQLVVQQRARQDTCRRGLAGGVVGSPLAV